MSLIYTSEYKPVKELETGWVFSDTTQINQHQSKGHGREAENTKIGFRDLNNLLEPSFNSARKREIRQTFYNKY